RVQLDHRIVVHEVEHLARAIHEGGYDPARVDRLEPVGDRPDLDEVHDPVREHLGVNAKVPRRTVRRTVPVARVAYMTEVPSVLCPSPRAWPSSCSTTVSKSNWSAPICVASAPAYQIHPLISVISPASVVQPSTPSAEPPTALLSLMSRMTSAWVGSLTRVT